jgi:transcriptional regulator with XRE-family HTH domain
LRVIFHVTQLRCLVKELRKVAGKRTPPTDGTDGEATTPRKNGNPIDQHVGARVRMRRLLLGMSQEKLGTALSLTFQQVQKYEKGTNRIGASRLQHIAKVLGVPPAFFFDGATSEVGDSAIYGVAEQAGANYVADFLGTTEGLTLNRAFARITDARIRRRVVDLVVSIADTQADLPSADTQERSE